MRRREFIALLGGSVAPALPKVAFAQQGARRIGVVMNLNSDDPEAQARIGAFLQGLQQFGWSIGRNLRIEYRWAGSSGGVRAAVEQMVALKPEVILAETPPVMFALREIGRAVPVVFTAVTDPVGMGLVQSLSRPGGNATGFMSAEFSISAKWLELLREIAPTVRRVAVLQGPGNRGSLPQFAAIQTAASSLGMEPTPIDVGDAGELERSVDAFARSKDGGLIANRTSEVIALRDLIIRLAAKHRLPAVYPLRFFVPAGGLASYGPDIVDEFRLAAGYVDRILRGEKPADLPVQAPTKYELAVNLKTAKALGLAVSPSLLARADEVIE